MRAPWKRAAVLALATCGFSIIGGCKTDVESSDEKVAGDVEMATASLQAGHPEKLSESLEKAVASSSVSPLAKVQSNSVLAQVRVDSANALLQKVSQQQAIISGLLIGLERLGWQIASNNGSVTGFLALNPKDGQQAFEKVATAAEKGEGGAWVTGEAPIPSLADVKQREDALAKQIDDLTKQRTEIAAKRSTALQQAENFSRQADSSSGSTSVAFYIQGSNQRKEAALDEVQMRDLDSKIQPLQQQLDVAKGQQQSIEGTLASVNDQVQKLQAGWQGVQKQMEQLKEFSASMVNGGGAAANAGGAVPTTQPMMSLNETATELKKQIDTANDFRMDAVKLLTDAYKNLADAQTQAGTAMKSIPSPTSIDGKKVPDKAAWQALIDMNSAAGFKVRQAEVLSARARVYAGQFIELAQRNAVARLLDTALKQSGVESPAAAALGNGGAPSAKVRETVDKIGAAIGQGGYTGFSEQAGEIDGLEDAQSTPSDQEAIASLRADFYYLWSNNVATDVVGGNPPGELGQISAMAAHLIQMTNNYGWSQLGMLQGKAAETRGRLAAAISERKILSENDVGKGLLPPLLPPDLAEVATSQPAGQAAGEATSQPAATEPVPGAAAAAPAETSDQAAVRAAGLACVEAIVAGDLDKAKTMILTQGIEFNSMASYIKAYADFRTAATKKFGDAVQTLAAPLPDMHEVIRTAQITVTGDTAQMVSPLSKDPIRADRQAGAWKISFLPAESTAAGKIILTLNLVTPIYSRTLAALQNDKYKTIDDMKQAMEKEFVDSKIPLPPPPTTGPAQ